MATSTSSPSPYNTAPSTPKLTSFSSDDNIAGNDLFFFSGESFSSIPFNWEHKPGLPKPPFSFNFNLKAAENEEPPSIDTHEEEDEEEEEDEVAINKPTAVVLPLKPPPQSQTPLGASARDLLGKAGTTSKRSFWGRRLRVRSCDFDPFEAAIESARRDIMEEVKESRSATTSFSKRVRKLLPFIRRERGVDDSSHSADYSSSSSTGTVGSVSGSKWELNRSEEEKRESSRFTRAYKYGSSNGCVVLGCLGFDKVATLHGFVKELVSLSP